MPDSTDLEAILSRIGALARQAAADESLPESVKPLLAEIVALARRSNVDTPGASDIPRTDNQSL